MENMKVLVTGASSGIGEATAYAFSASGSDLFLVARREERLARIAQECRKRGAGQALYRPHDLSLAGEGAVVVRECLDELGGLDLLICNAGYGVYGPIKDVTPAEMQREWQVNFQSGFESIHAALPHFLARQSGHIVVVSSVIGRKALPYAGAYCSTKFAQAGLAESLWGEVRPQGIGVSLICPGFTATEFQNSVELAGEYTPFRRPFKGQSPDVVARAIVDAVHHKRREVHLTLGGKLLLFLNRLSPCLTNHLVKLVTRT
ncbi:MAG: SDR family NAD(P)-dependent oxidoreductase [Acidobacteriota bacterium]